MTNVAWVGKLSNFQRNFQVRHTSIFVDEKNDTTYYCISKREDMLGRRFNKIEIGWYEHDNAHYFGSIYNEIEQTRLIPQK